jgi:RNA recognition motif-containing protein
MNPKLRVDGLPAGTTEGELRAWFEPHGNVGEVNVPINRTNGRPGDFAFVTMATPEGAQAAIRALHGKALSASTLTVVVAPPYERRTVTPQRR